MADIFISYRRHDSRADAGRLYDRLAARFGDESVFMDIDDIEPGENFVEVLDATLERCGAMIVLMGQRWNDAADAQGELRLHDPNDFVRIEIERALQRNISVVPVLVGGATMPKAESLPETLRSLTRHQALEVSDQRFHPDVDRLIGILHPIVGPKRRPGRWRRGLGAAALLGVVIAAGATYFAFDQYRSPTRLAPQNAVDLDVGDQFAARGELTQAVAQYQRVLERAPGNEAALRRLLATSRERLQRAAFLGTSVDVGLRRDFRRIAPVEDEPINEALGYLYELQAREPDLKRDAELALEQGRILKTSGTRIDAAISALQRAHTLAPDAPEVLAELGLIKAVVLNDAQGISQVRDAATAAPQNPRYRFYLGRSLAEHYRCTAAGPRPAGEQEHCAAALRHFYEANRLATGQDVWDQHLLERSAQSALDVFQTFAREDGGILTAHLDLTLEERAAMLEYLIPRERSRSRSGWEDEPRYWLALLYEARDDPIAAQGLLRDLIAARGERSVLWLTAYARVLERTGDDPVALAATKRTLAGAR